MESTLGERSPMRPIVLSVSLVALLVFARAGYAATVAEIANLKGADREQILVKAEEAPKTYEELTDPKWKGKLCWAVTSETGGAMMFISFMRMIMGEEKGEAYLRELAKQNIANMTGSPREVVNKVMQGECA